MQESENTERLKSGDRVRVRLEDRADEWTNAFVAVASDGTVSSVGLILDGVVRAKGGGLIASALPLTIDYERQTAVSLFGDSYEIEVMEGEKDANA